MKNGKYTKRKSRNVLIFGLTLLLACPATFAATKFEQLSEEAETAYKNRRYPEAQKAFEQAIKEATDKLDKTDKRIATLVYNLSLVFQAQGNYAEAEKNMLKALELMSYYYGAEHQRVAQVYMDLADLYVEQAGQEDKPELKKKAAENYKKGIEIFEKIYAQSTGEGAKDKPPDSKKGDSGKKTPQEAAADLSNALRCLADTYAEDELYELAEPLYKHSLELEEFASGPESKDLAKHKSKLAETYCVQAKYKPAEPLFKDALEISLKVNGADSQETAQIQYNYGGMYFDQGQFGEAEVLFKKAIKTFTKDPDAKEMDIAQKNVTLAEALDMEGKAEEAQSLYKQSLTAFEKAEDKGALMHFLKQYQKHLLMQNKKEEAAKIAARIKDIKAELTKPQ